MSEEKKVNETEEKHGVELTDEELSSVAAGIGPTFPGHVVVE